MKFHCLPIITFLNNLGGILGLLRMNSPKYLRILNKYISMFSTESGWLKVFVGNIGSNTVPETLKIVVIQQDEISFLSQIKVGICSPCLVRWFHNPQEWDSFHLVYMLFVIRGFHLIVQDGCSSSPILNSGNWQAREIESMGITLSFKDKTGKFHLSLLLSHCSEINNTSIPTCKGHWEVSSWFGVAICPSKNWRVC